MIKSGSKDYVRKIIIIILALIFIGIPLYILVINSFKSLEGAKTADLALPEVWQIKENYTKVYNESEFLISLRNSLIYLFTVIPSVILIGAMAGWIFARGKSKLIRFGYFFSIAGILIPPAIVTSIKLLSFLNIYGTVFGLYIFYVGTTMAFTIFFCTGFIKSIPIQLEEAARIDGCNNFQIFIRIILPLIKPVIATIAVFLGINIWNDFMWPFYILRSTDQFTLVLRLFSFVSSEAHSTNWHLVFADVVMISLPFVLLYAFAQRYIVSGIMSGAVKQ
jgi:raffinose/stachyose/melibiose transport system permease protein